MPCGLSSLTRLTRARLAGCRVALGGPRIRAVVVVSPRAIRLSNSSSSSSSALPLLPVLVLWVGLLLVVGLQPLLLPHRAAVIVLRRAGLVVVVVVVVVVLLLLPPPPMPASSRLRLLAARLCKPRVVVVLGPGLAALLLPAPASSSLGMAAGLFKAKVDVGLEEG